MLIRSSLLLVSLTGSAAVAVENEPPKRVEVKWLPEEGACGSPYKMDSEEGGGLLFSFDELNSEASAGKYRSVCRLAGEITVPQGFRLDPQVSLSALVKGEIQARFDNVTGRLKFGLGRYISRDFQLAEYKEPAADNNSHKSKLSKASGKWQDVKLELKATVPELPYSCKEDVVWPLSLFIESTINGVARSRIESMKLDSLNLLPLDCPAPPVEPTKI